MKGKEKKFALYHILVYIIALIFITDLNNFAKEHSVYFFSKFTSYMK